MEIISIKGLCVGARDGFRPVHAKSGGAIPVVGVQRALRESHDAAAAPVVEHLAVGCASAYSLGPVRYDQRRVRHFADVGEFVDADEKRSLLIEIR